MASKPKIHYEHDKHQKGKAGAPLTACGIKRSPWGIHLTRTPREATCRTCRAALGFTRTPKPPTHGATVYVHTMNPSDRALGLCGTVLARVIVSDRPLKKVPCPACEEFERTFVEVAPA